MTSFCNLYMVRGERKRISLGTLPLLSENVASTPAVLEVRLMIRVQMYVEFKKWLIIKLCPCASVYNKCTDTNNQLMVCVL